MHTLAVKSGVLQGAYESTGFLPDAPLRGRVRGSMASPEALEPLALQRHLKALLKFAPVESRFCSFQRRGKVTFEIPINPCARSACSRSVAVGLVRTKEVGT